MIIQPILILSLVYMSVLYGFMFVVPRKIYDKPIANVEAFLMGFTRTLFAFPAIAITLMVAKLDVDVYAPLISSLSILSGLAVYLCRMTRVNYGRTIALSCVGEFIALFSVALYLTNR